MTGISRAPWRAASALVGLTALLVAGCGGRSGSAPRVDPTAPRLVPVSAVIVLETSGPPPSDTTVELAAGAPHVVVLRHGPPENVVFAEVSFPPTAFRTDSGRVVRVELRPRPGVYGLDILANQPLAGGVSVTFKYARYFLAPARARESFGSDVLFEKALAVGQLLPSSAQLALLPSTRPAPDNLRGPVPAAGTYLVAAAP
jgi:hypothetical protein